MKRLLSFLMIAVGLSLSVPADGNTGKTNPLSPPDFPEPAIAVVRESPALFKQYLDNGHADDMYELFESYLRQIANRQEENTTPEEWKAGLWICYYVAKAPTMPFHHDAWWGPDYEAKGKALDYLTRMNICLVSRTTNIPEEKLRLLTGELCAFIVHTLRSNYDPGMEERQKELIADNKTRLASDDVQWARFFGGLQNMKMRNEAAGKLLCDSEKQFMQFLLNCYGNSPDRIFLHIRKAGYPEREWEKLLDRTLGRNDATKALYSSLPQDKGNTRLKP